MPHSLVSPFRPGGDLSALFRFMMRILAGAVLSQSPLSLASAQSLIIGGTGAALGGMQTLSDAFVVKHEGVEINVLPSLGSSGGIKALLEERIDVAVFSRPLSKQERKKGAMERMYAQTRLVLAAHPEVETNALNPKDVIAIYSGQMTTWPDGTPLRLVMRPPHETDFKILRRWSQDFDQAIALASQRSGLLIAETDQHNCSMIEQLPGAFGFASLAQIISEQRRIKVLTLEDDEAFDEDQFDFTKPLYVGIRAESPPLASAFVDFVLSDDGRQLLVDNGHDLISEVVGKQ